MKTYSMRFGAGDPRTYTGLAPTMLIFVNMSSGATLAAPAVTESLTGSGVYQFQWGTTTPIAFLADAATTSPGAQSRYVVGQLDPADRSDEYGTSLMAFGASLVALGTTNIGFGVSNFALGTTSVAIGTTNIGFGVSNIALGTTSVALGSTNLGYGVSNLAIGTTILAGQVALGNSVIALGNSLAVIGVSLNVIMTAIGSTASSFGDSATDPATLFGYLKRVQENLEGDSNYVKVSGLWTILDRTSGTTFVQKTITNSATMVTKL